MPGIRILIVDDDAITRLALNAVLSQMGYTVSAVVTNGDDALQQVSANPPNLVLTDVSLGRGIDGIELTALLGKSCAMPVMCMSGHTDENTLRRARRAGAAGYLVKPFSDLELRQCVANALRAPVNTNPSGAFFSTSMLRLPPLVA